MQLADPIFDRRQYHTEIGRGNLERAAYINYRACRLVGLSGENGPRCRGKSIDRSRALPRAPLRRETSSHSHMEPMTMTTTDCRDFESEAVLRLRDDLALALRAAAHHGLAEGICNHFSVELPDRSGRFLLNPRGLLWSEVQADDIVMVDGQGSKRAGVRAVEPTAMFIHAAIHRLCAKACVLHTHMPYATSLTLTADRCLDTTLSQNAMRFHGRIAADAQYNGLALDSSEGERIAAAMGNADVAFLGNHGVVVCGEQMAYAYDDLYYLERACMAQVLAQSTGRVPAPVDASIAERVRDQTLSDRLQSELFFEALRRADARSDRADPTVSASRRLEA
jgi:ribulose-5-phosphate 4-epimerase/fuculose-1-phosphate aldolase